MKPFLLSAVLFASALPIFAQGFGQEQKSSRDTEAAVLKLEQQWEDALTKSDTAALDKLYADGLIYTHSNGKVDSKASFMNNIKSGASKYESMKRDDIKVVVYGQSAVVACHWEVHVSSQNKKTDLNARYLHVYVQQPDGWKLVAHESTRIIP